MLYTITYENSVLLEVDKLDGWQISCDDHPNVPKVTERTLVKNKIALLELNELPVCITNSMIAHNKVLIHYSSICTFFRDWSGTKVWGLKALWETEDHLVRRVLDRILS